MNCLSNNTLPEGCPLECTACKHKHYSDDESLSQKENFVRSKLSELANQVLKIRHTIPYQRFGYRNKTCMACFFDGNVWQAGIHKRDEILPIPNCPLHSEEIRNTWHVLKDTFPTSINFPLHWYVQCGKQIVLVLKTNTKPNYIIDEITDKVLKKIGIEGIWIHLNPSTGHNVFGKVRWELIWGVPRSKGFYGFEYGPIAFQQVLPQLYDNALDESIDFFQPNKNDQVVDLYTGIGISLQKWKEKGAQALGVELCGEAVECALQNVPCTTILRGKCSDRIPQINQWLNHKDNFKLFVNPPRIGLEDRVIEWLLNETSPTHIAYLSCSPGSLQRNLQMLSKRYRLQKAIPFDFFPNTHHVETLALLKKKH